LDEVRIELAPINPAERTPQGSAIKPTSAGGSWVPVILVHGWASQSTHPNTDGNPNLAGAFSHMVDLTANKLGRANVPRSLVGQLQDVPGAAVFTFDYHPYSGRWVTDSHLGPALGKVIDCLAKASGQEVIVVGHSMGGLIARYAAANPDRSGVISKIITLGTPSVGSIAARLADSSIAAGSLLFKQLVILRLILSTCGQVSTQSLDGGSLCALLPPPVRAFDSEAGRALRAGSAELGQLKPIPAAIPVNALAGATGFHVPKVGWFSLPWETDTIPVGDVIVTENSALAGATVSKTVSCAYQLSPVRSGIDQAGLILKLTAANDVAGAPLGAFSGPCFHTSLMRSIELSNEVLGAVNDYINPRLTSQQIQNTIIPAGSCGAADEGGWLQEEPITLRKGIGTTIKDPDRDYGASILEIRIVGRADMDRDGREDLVLAYKCAGSAPERCCAGQGSLRTFVGIFAEGPGGRLSRTLPVYFGGESRPGGEFGPADHTISEVRLDGRTLITTEHILYADMYTPEQVGGGDPQAPITVRSTLEGTAWVSK